MALDTYLVVFYHFDTQSLRKLEIKYIGVITILSFIPAFVFLFIRDHKGPIYGDETVSTFNQLETTHVLKLIELIDLVLSISQLDAPAHNLLLCTRMVRILLSVCLTTCSNGYTTGS